MLLTNYHTHTNFCDGVEIPELYAREAVKQSLEVLGYSAHAPLPFPCSWTLPYEKYQDYLNAIRQLKQSYEGRLEILCGLEIDYIPGLWSKIREMLQPEQLDYFIGSIHFVDAFNDETPWSIDGSHEEFYKGWTEIFHKDSHSLVRKYFAYTRQMIRDMKPPVIGHLDKIKMQHKADCFIPETDPVYKEELLATVEEIAHFGGVVEINTRGVYRRGEPEFYPSQWLLKEMNRLNIPVIVNSDAHRPHEIVLLRTEALKQLKDAGYKSIRHFSAGKWIDEDIIV